jgi:hypothetical protein
MSLSNELLKIFKSLIAILDPLKDFNLGIILYMDHHKWDPICFKIIKRPQPMRVVEEFKIKNGTRTLIFEVGY